MSDDSGTTPWPDVLRKCFASGEEWHLNACVEFVQSNRHEMYAYREGYRRAATMLFETAVAARRCSPDLLVFPLAFLWRHHLELALKELVGLARRLEDDDRQMPSHHRLVPLWSEVRRYMEAEFHGDTKELDNVEALIREFDRIDEGSFGFRYPTAKDWVSRSLPNAPSLVNLGAMHDAMEPVANFLDCAITELGMRLDYKVEAESEAARGC